MAVWVGGAAGKPALVLLHGAGDHAGAWAQVLDGLVEEYRVVVPDLPGHGDSAPAEGTIEMATVLGGVVALLESEVVRGDGPPPIVVGNSLGGWLALLVGAQRPELASRLVAIDGGGTPGPVDPAVLLPADREEAAAVLDLVGAPGPFPDAVLDDVVRRARDGALGRFMAAGDHASFDLTGRLGEVAVPVDLVWGELDGYFPISYAEATAAALPAARLTVIEGCGHVPPRYCPDRFAAVLAEVLAAPPPERSSAGTAAPEAAAGEGAPAALPELPVTEAGR
jgi:pimeloyl-ACP methyl ester carboxylesterase